MILKNEFEKLLKNKKYFLPIRRTKRSSFDNYYRNVFDPDGKSRNLKNEKFKKIKDLKIILDYLKKVKKEVIYLILVVVMDGCYHN